MISKRLQSGIGPVFFVPNGLVSTKLLDCHEKLVYVAIRKYANAETKTAFPSLRTLADNTGFGVRCIRRAIQGLEDKGILQVSRTNGENGEHKVNIYRFCDTAETWEAKTVDDMRKAAFSKPVTDDEKRTQAAQLLREVGFTAEEIEAFYEAHSAESKKNGLPETGISESPENHMYSKNYNLQEQDTAQQAGIQADCEESPEEISISDLKEAIGYDAEAVPEMDRFLYDVAVLALSDALKGPTRAVDRQGLELLRHDDLLEAIDRMKGQKGVKNPRRYLKQVLLNMVQEKKLEAQKPIQGRKSPAGTFGNFTEREYDFAELERKLLLSQDDYNS